ncbi:MAG: hypothetical protein KAS62_01665, partial [Candidatus Delongbacteria bacterium]|nr:hypothetical protein [Candidatus Delongbacteria bacterium]
ESAKKNWLKFLGMIIFAIIVMALTAYIGYSIGETVGSLLIMIVMILLSFGFIKNTINLTRDEPIDFKAFFNSNPMTMANFLIAMLISSILITIGFFFLIIPGFILAYMLILVPYLIIDKDMGPMEAISESMRLTKGYKMDIFAGHFIVMIIVQIISMFIITLPFTIPMILFVQIYPYLVLTGQIEKGAPQVATEPEVAAEPEPAVTPEAEVVAEPEVKKIPEQEPKQDQE